MDNGPAADERRTCSRREEDLQQEGGGATAGEANYCFDKSVREGTGEMA